MNKFNFNCLMAFVNTLGTLLLYSSFHVYYKKLYYDFSLVFIIVRAVLRLGTFL